MAISTESWNSLINLTIRDREEEIWKIEMSKKPKLRTYIKLKTNLEKEEYLMEDDIRMRRSDAIERRNERIKN